MLNSLNDKTESFARLIEVLDTLRVKCPWDAKQTNESLRPNTIEETYELADAILTNEPTEIKKELGDLLLHVLFYAKIADEKEQFDIADVCNAICDKLIYRHPHVFGSTEVSDADEVSQNWEQLKLKEKGGNKTVLSGVPNSLPSLIKAYRIQEKAANVGFDWLNPEDVWAKVKEELMEVETEIKADNKANMEAEFGDLLFSIINAARVYGINPENALERCNKKFISRFNHIEAEGKKQGKTLTEMALDEMDELWNDAKRIERNK